MVRDESTKPVRKGLLALLKESMAKATEGCGPGCGCHAEGDRGKSKGGSGAADSTEEEDR